MQAEYLALPWIKNIFIKHIIFNKKLIQKEFWKFSSQGFMGGGHIELALLEEFWLKSPQIKFEYIKNVLIIRCCVFRL